MKKFICLLGILSLMLSSCSSKGEVEGEVERIPDDEPFLDQPISPEVRKREPIYVYDKEKKETLSKITLKLNGEPLLLASGYVRLAGVVSGGMPIALLEVGGKGLALRAGDMVSGYKIMNICKEEIRLRREEGK